MPYNPQDKLKTEKNMTNSLDKVLSLITSNPEEAELYMKASQLNQTENDKLQDQLTDLEATQVRSVINRGLAKNQKEALKLLSEAPF